MTSPMFVRQWGRSAVSGALILVSLLLAQTIGGLPADVVMLAAATVAGLPIVLSAFRALRNRIVGIDLLVSVASIGAIVIGNYWEAAAVTFLFTIGHALEQATLGKTRSALAELVATVPEQAVVIRDGQQSVVPAATVVVGETVLVKTGARVPVDGWVSEGNGAVDESSITGESMPAEKAPGDVVHAGTISTAGLMHITAEKVGADTTLAAIIHRVEEAQDAKAPTQAFMDRFSRWYTPAIIVLSLVTGLVTRDTTLALTLLVIGCPGALVISIPVAIVAGIGRGARDGVLIKGGEHLETAAKISAVALDKTGTLTLGSPRLTDVVGIAGVSGDEVLAWAAGVEVASDHPLAAPIIEGAKERGVLAPALPTDVQTVLGRGVTGTVNGRSVGVGNLALLNDWSSDPSSRDQAEAVMEELADNGRTPMVVVVDGIAVGVVGVADSIRDAAPDMVAALHRIGIRRVVMLTGDRAQVAHSVALQVGVDEVRAELLPEGKLDAIRSLQQDGHVVAMVGDGINDAPALATADVGVAMGAAGSAVAIETADIALMGDRLERLPEALGLARRTVAVMRQNIVIALMTVVLLLAGVFFGGVTMSIGMLVHEASVLIVILNAMRLLRAPRSAAPRRTSPVAARERVAV